MEIKIIKKPNSYKTGGEIHIKKSHEGLFTQKANRAGMGVQQFASHVLANKENYSPETVKQANFARNAAKWHANGGFLNNLGFFEERKIGEQNSSNSSKNQSSLQSESPTSLFAEGGNLLAEGGTILGGYHTNGADWETPGGFHIIGSGGTHEENKNEGVLQGTDQQGVPNLVEENEVVYNDYVFSARLTVPKRRQGTEKEISDLAWEEKMLKPYEGKTYAEAAQKAYKEVQERPNDPIAKRGLETILGILANSQEKERAKKEHQDAAEEITEMSGQEFAQAKAAEEQQQAIAQAAQEQAIQQQMQEQQTQEQQMQGQQAQEPSPEEIAMMQQQQAMQQAGQAEVSALGGNIHAYGGNFYDNGGQLDLQRYQQIFQQIAQYAMANKEEQPELFNAVTQVKTPQDMLQFVSNFLAAQEAQRQQQSNPQSVTQPPIEETIVENPEEQQFVDGGHKFDDGGKFLDWWKKSFDTRTNINWGKVYDSYFGTNKAAEINAEESPSKYVQEALKAAYEADSSKFDTFDDNSGLFVSTEAKQPEVKQLTDKQKDKAQRQLNRYYRKKGIDPTKLTGDAKDRYAKDLQAMYDGMSIDDKYDFAKDENLAINNANLSTKTKKSNVATYLNNAYYDAMISRGAKAVELTDDGKVKWNNIDGLSRVDNTAENFYSNPANFTESNGIYDYNDGSKGYKSKNFASPEEFQQYYRTAITDRFKSLKGNKYSDKRLPNYYLNASQLRSWVNDLEASNDPKAKELALALKANWGDKDTSWSNDATWNLKNKYTKNGTVTESKSYLDIPAVKENGLQKDALPGIEHIPYLDAIRTDPTANRYFYKDSEGQQHFITRPTNTSFTISDTPVQSKVGDINYNDYEVKGFNQKRKLYKTPDGRVLDVTDMSDINNGKWKDIDNIVMPDDTSNLGEGITGESSWVDTDEAGNGVDFPLPSNWPWIAGIGLQAGTTLYNAFKPIDYSNADAVIRAANEVGNFQPINFRPIGDYLTYRPLDRNYEGNKVRSAMAAERRELANLSGGNRGTAAAGILASDYNLINQLGDIDRKAAEANRAQEAKVAEFNRGTNQFNSEGFLKADMSNQDAMSRANQAKLEGLIKGYTLRQAAEDAKANAINAGISGIAENLFGLYQQNYNNALVKYGMDTSTYGTANYNWKKNSEAQGGKLRTRRKRGLTF